MVGRRLGFGRARLASSSILALLLAQVPSTQAATAPRSFAVRDSIEMVQLVEPMSAARSDAGDFAISPLGTRFLLLTRRGNLASGANEYKLESFEVSDVLAFVNGAPTMSSPPRGRVLAARFTSPDAAPLYRHAIEQARWVDENTVTYIGRRADEVGQVFRVDVRTTNEVQLTAGDTDILRYAMSADGKTIVYSALSFPNWRERNRHGYVVRSNSISEFVTRDPREAGPQLIRYFAKNLATGTVWPSDAEPAVAPTPIWLSPSGNHAVVVSHKGLIPRAWAEYAFAQELQETANKGQENAAPGFSRAAWLESDLFGQRDASVAEFMLVDTRDGSARTLLDAPSVSASRAIWSRGGERVILQASFLPLETVGVAERERRRLHEALVEVDLQSMGVARLTDEPMLLGAQVEWLSDDVIALSPRHGDAAGKSVMFRRVNGSWRQVRNDGVSPATGQSPPRLELRIVQDMNTPPDVEASDALTGKRRVFTDLNPQLRAFDLGLVRPFEWSDTYGRTFRGGLVLPPKYDQRRERAVVLQTYGFDPAEFLVDGPQGMMTSFAARALAGSGILVLQMPRVSPEAAAPIRSEADYQRDGENPRFVSMMAGAIDALVEQDIAAKEQIGVVGFSRSGMQVHYAITFSKRSIAAASIADSAAATPLSYSMWYGTAALLQFERDTLLDGSFWGQRMDLWRQRSPIFHLDRIHTPLRYEFHSTSGSYLAHWDTFVLLKRNMKPVEMIQMPIASHNVEAPFARYTSQQGTVDWFAFWLNGYERTTPNPEVMETSATLEEQYARWRCLRAEHDADTSERRIGSH